MNVLFCTEKQISPLFGGTEQITQTIAQKLMSLGNNCFSLYIQQASSDIPLSKFTDSRKLRESVSIKSQINQVYDEYNITDCIVNFVSHRSKKLLMPIIYEEAKKRNIKVFYCYHAMPGEDFYGAPLGYCWYKISHGYDVIQSLKDILLALTPRCIWKPLIIKKYRVAFENSDKTILLSPRFIPIYKELAGLSNVDKFSYIFNALSFDSFLQSNELNKKEKEVLIIARMDERSKRISLALKIWQQIEKNAENQDWRLTIVGGGHDLEYFKKLCQSLSLKRCCFEGRVNDIMPYYRRASIFMMTSAYEGFGLTLTEAQQNGVVPIVFDSYASLHDIIISGRNGIIVENNNINAYVSECISLMKDTKRRLKLAENALQDCKQFSQDKIIQRWLDIL